jgi:peroxiredoxin
MLTMIGIIRTLPLLSLATILCILTLVGSGLCFSGCRRNSDLHVPAAEVGVMAPEVSLPDMTGRQVSLGQFRGQKVLLAFWASWCPPCQTEISSLQRLHDNPAVRNLKILAVNVGENKGQIASFIARQHLSLPILVDTEGIVQQRYGVQQLPIVFLVDGQGKIIARHLGLRDWNSRDAISELNQLGGE